ncbi:MAG: hypothetical protein IPN43_06000 [Chitinophagaceae bacterium]|nr:hypothetical protein [Chitinophagaceae bacterium]
MFKNQTIKKIAAAALLMVFAFSITPAIVFHNWLVSHTDTYKKETHSKGAQLGKQTFNCHCDHVVAESPFTGPDKATINYHAASFFLFKAELQVQFTSSPNIHYSLRGPPAV